MCYVVYCFTIYTTVDTAIRVLNTILEPCLSRKEFSLNNIMNTNQYKRLRQFTKYCEESIYHISKIQDTGNNKDKG